jgi:hypothetical protein
MLNHLSVLDVLHATVSALERKNFDHLLKLLGKGLQSRASFVAKRALEIFTEFVLNA